MPSETVDYKSYPLVVVVWQDCTSHTSWTNADDLQYIRKALFNSAGWLIEEDEYSLTLAIHTDGYTTGDISIIPKGCIVHREDLPVSSIKLPALRMDFGAALRSPEERKVEVHASP